MAVETLENPNPVALAPTARAGALVGEQAPVVPAGLRVSFWLEGTVLHAHAELVDAAAAPIKRVVLDAADPLVGKVFTFFANKLKA